MNRHFALTRFWMVAGLVWICVIALAGVAAAQMQDEMQDLLCEMLDELDPDLQEKFQSALDQNSNRVVLTPDQFRRFREHPLNPFEGMSGIDPDKLKGNIELKFEIPSLRNRAPSPLERQHPDFLRSVAPATSQVSNSVVTVLDGDRQLCLGTVVALPVRILAKASEMAEAKSLTVRTASGKVFPVKLAGHDPDNDLAILEITSSLSGIQSGLQPVQWSTRQPQPGEFVITAVSNQTAWAVGTYSNPPRALRKNGQGLLGVQPENCEGGVRLVDITPGGAASVAGLEVDDVIVRLDDQVMTDVTQLVSEIGKRSAGDEITLQVKRGNQHKVIRAVLSGRELSAEKASKFRMMNRLGAIPSKRNDGFQWVFQHDTPLFPEQCGGPILDLQGNVLGINIAREGRVSSLAIPSTHLQTILPGLLRENVAAK